jgi:hypothetical protein
MSFVVFVLLLGPAHTVSIFSTNIEVVLCQGILIFVII